MPFFMGDGRIWIVAEKYGIFPPVASAMWHHIVAGKDFTAACRLRGSGQGMRGESGFAEAGEDAPELLAVEAHVAGGDGVPCGGVHGAEPRVSEAHPGIEIGDRGDGGEQSVAGLLVSGIDGGPWRRGWASR